LIREGFLGRYLSLWAGWLAVTIKRFTHMCPKWHTGRGRGALLVCIIVFIVAWPKSSAHVSVNGAESCSVRFAEHVGISDPYESINQLSAVLHALYPQLICRSRFWKQHLNCIWQHYEGGFRASTFFGGVLHVILDVDRSIGGVKKIVRLNTQRWGLARIDNCNLYGYGIRGFHLLHGDLCRANPRPLVQVKLISSYIDRLLEVLLGRSKGVLRNSLLSGDRSGIVECGLEASRFHLLQLFPHCFDLIASIMGIKASDDYQEDGTRCLNPYWCSVEIAEAFLFACAAVGLFVFGGAAADLRWRWRIACWLGCAGCYILSIGITHIALSYRCWFG
jgi:hypothetical protein